MFLPATLRDWVLRSSSAFSAVNHLGTEPMANFTGHITTSATLGVAYGIWGSYHLQLDWGPYSSGLG